MARKRRIIQMKASNFVVFLIVTIGLVPYADAFETIEAAEWSLTPMLQTRFGLQIGDNLNYGFGAADNPLEKERTNASLSLEPALAVERPLLGGTFFGKASVVAAANLLEGELSGQFARGGDSRIKTDEVHVGWRNDSISISVGPQRLMIADGFLIGDGNFDTGSKQGEYWVAPFDAWQHAAVLKATGETIRGEAFWLQSDGGFGDSRLYGFNIENADTHYGRYGAMFINVYDGNALGYDGVKAWNLRALDVPVPYLSQLRIFAEVAWESGQDDDGDGADIAGLGWYVETAFTVPNLPWHTVLTYRFSRFSGEDLTSSDSEAYRPLFYGFGARAWDTFYQGEIAGEYHLFNSNQVTQFVKLTTAPSDSYALTFYYYKHDLDERHFFGEPVSSRDWADEINAGVEYFASDRVYIYAGVAWSTPKAGARQIFGADDFTVVQTWMQFNF